MNFFSKEKLELLEITNNVRLGTEQNTHVGTCTSLHNILVLWRTGARVRKRAGNGAGKKGKRRAGKKELWVSGAIS
jgi:hypothetical protein